jgi:hypothetical protein
MPGLPCRFIWQVEEGGSSAKRWTPLPRKPRSTAKSGPEAGRRPGDLLRTTPRDQHLEINRVRRPAGTSRPLTRRGSHCSMVPLDVIAEAGLASTLPHIRSGRLIDAGLRAHLGRREEVHVGSLRAPASPAEAGVASASDACPRLVLCERRVWTAQDDRLHGRATLRSSRSVRPTPRFRGSRHVRCWA